MVNTITTIEELENKPVQELTKKEKKQLAEADINRQKDELKKDLENIQIVYCSYLNTQGTEMLFYYIDESKQYYKHAVLQKIWISPKTLYDSDSMKVERLDFKDKPSSWEKSRSGQYHYCFRATGYGYSKSDHCLDSLYSWLYGYGSDKRRSVKIENLN